MTSVIQRHVSLAFVSLIFSSTTLSISDARCVATEPSESKSFGQRQIEQVICDRPSMKGLICEGGELYDLVVMRFNKGASGNRVYWDVDVPADGINAEHQPKQDGGLPYVRITDAATVSGRDKWCLLIFELENLQNSKQAQNLHTQATTGSISRKEFVNEVIKLDFEAMLRTKDVLKASPISGVTKQSDPICTSIIGMGADFSLYLKHVSQHGPSEYRQYYEDRYDQLRKYGRIVGEMERKHIRELLR